MDPAPAPSPPPVASPAAAAKAPPDPLRRLLGWLQAALYAGIVYFLLVMFVAQNYYVPTPSMEPTIRGAGPDNPADPAGPRHAGDQVLVDKLTYRFRAPRRGEIVAFRPPHAAPGRAVLYIKRLAGLPGERIEIRGGRAFADGAPLDLDGARGPIRYSNPGGRAFQVPEGSYFFLGDNTEQSTDSREWGSVPAANVVGRALLILWPPARFGTVR